MTLVLAAGSMLDVDASGLVAAAAAAGFDGVGLRVTGPHRVSESDALRAQAAAAGVELHDAEVHRIGGATPAAAAIDAAAALGIGRLLVVSDLDDADATADELARVVTRAAARGVTIGLEYMAWTTPSDPDGALALARRTGCVVVVDLLHHVRVGAGPAELAAIVASGHLGWIQLCDAPRLAPTTDRLVHEARHGRFAPGEGGLPLGELLAVVPAGVTLSVEVQSDDLLALPPGERTRRLHRAAMAVVGDRGDHPSSTG